MSSMASIVRPGGRVTLAGGLDQEWGPAWERAFQPMRAALRAHRIQPRQVDLVCKRDARHHGSGRGAAGSAEHLPAWGSAVRGARTKTWWLGARRMIAI